MNVLPWWLSEACGSFLWLRRVSDVTHAAFPLLSFHCWIYQLMHVIPINLSHTILAWDFLLHSKAYFSALKFRHTGPKLAWYTCVWCAHHDWRPCWCKGTPPRILYLQHDTNCKQAWRQSCPQRMITQTLSHDKSCHTRNNAQHILYIECYLQNAVVLHRHTLSTRTKPSLHLEHTNQ